MLRYQAGEDTAFDQLVHRNAEKVHGLIHRFLGDPNQVEDLTQEVFLRIFRTAERYQPAAKFSTWLYRIVANLCFNAMRARRRGYARQLDAPNGEDAEAFFRGLPDQRHPGPHHGMDADELRRVMGVAIDALPGNQKLAIILNKYEGMSYEDIAEVLQCSDMAVKSLLSRARRNLRQTLEEYHADD